VLYWRNSIDLNRSRAYNSIEKFPIYKHRRQTMSLKFTAVITKEENWYVALCVELGVVSQGKTIEEAKANLKEAVELYIESFGTDDLPESKGEVILYPFEVVINA
jgi:predicted RNase H-like HicB family nuclease